MTDSDFIKLEKNEGVATITLDRPKHNVLNIEMMNTLNSELELLTKDKDLKCLVIGAAGPSFCAGVEVSDHRPEMVDEMIKTFNRIFELINAIEVPTIAAVDGACLGGGMEVAIACDMVVASPKAVFGQPEIKLGFFPPYAAIRLPELVGRSKAIEICTTGKKYFAKESLQMGLISQLTGEDTFNDELEKLIKEIRYCSPLIIRLNKLAVNRHIGLGFKEALSGVSDLFLNTLMKTDDTLEGIKSFEEKRRAQWKNS